MSKHRLPRASTQEHEVALTMVSNSVRGGRFFRREHHRGGDI